jgi:hypothetical protein
MPGVADAGAPPCLGWQGRREHLFRVSSGGGGAAGDDVRGRHHLLVAPGKGLGVVPPAPLQWRRATRQARLTAEVIRKE